MTPPRDPIYAGYRHPPEIICAAVWLYFRYPLRLRMVEELLAVRGIEVSYETVRQSGLKFGEVFARPPLASAATIRSARTQAFTHWAEVTGVAMAA